MTSTTLTDGSPVTQDHREIDPKTGMQKGYVVLSEEERAKGFVEPVRRSYRHIACGGVTTMGQALAETYARDPFFYSGTFCAICGTHFDVGEDGQFVWDGTDQKVGTRRTAEAASAVSPTPVASAAADLDQLIMDIRNELLRARAKFPGDNVTFFALVEEVGELAKASFEESRDRVRKEAVQVAVMAIRMVLDGDVTLTDWRRDKGLDPLK